MHEHGIIAQTYAAVLTEIRVVSGETWRQYMFSEGCDLSLSRNSSKVRQSGFSPRLRPVHLDLRASSYLYSIPSLVSTGNGGRAGKTD
jgi:hypothetical protein